MGAALAEQGYYSRIQEAHVSRRFYEDRNKPTFVPELALQVARIRKEGEKSSALYLLHDTGFHIGSQIDLLESNRREGKSMEVSFAQLEQDIQAFKTEYLVQGLLFPIVLDKKMVNGKKRVVGVLYGDKPLVDATDEKERGGVVKKSVARVEQFLLTAKPGSTLVMSSPAGWSGYEGITYQDTQTYIWHVQPDGSLRGFTVRTDMDMNQNEALLVRLGVDRKTFEKKTNEKDRIKRVVENIVAVENMQIHTVVGILQEVKGTSVAYTDTTGRNRFFDEIYTQLRNPTKLWNLDGVTQELVDSVKEQVEYEFSKDEEEYDRKNLEIGLGRKILELMHAMSIFQGEDVLEKGRQYSVRNLREQVFDPGKMLDEMQKLPGCAGGGKKTTTTITSITPRSTLQEWFQCPKCQFQADGPVGNACPNCGLTKEQYAQEEGVVTCD